MGSYFCESCLKLHTGDEMCPKIQEQLKESPELLAGAASFANVAAQYRLVTSEDLKPVYDIVNGAIGTNLEGTHQFARDIQVFQRLDVENFKHVGYFRTPEAAAEYLKYLEAAGEKNITMLDRQITGAAQEVDWLRFKQAQLSSLWGESTLLEGRAPGVDGVTVNRFTGKQISRTTVKATVDNPAGNISKIKQSIEDGYTSSEDIIFGVKGTRQAAEKAGLENKVIEKNTMEQVKESNQRLRDKMAAGEAVTSVTGEQLRQKMVQGAVIGAAVSLTISSLTQYIRYKNGEITLQEAFANVSEQTAKGTLIGGAMAGITIFLPAGLVGFLGGMAIGMYLNATLTNILAEIWGKGLHRQILLSAGHIMGTSLSVADVLAEIRTNVNYIDAANENARQKSRKSREKLDQTRNILGGL